MTDQYTKVEKLRLLHSIRPLEFNHPDADHEHEPFCDPVGHRIFGSEEWMSFLNKETDDG